jgi:ketosteroid isomerase-like protein
MMDTRAVAEAFTKLLREGQDAGAAFWHEDVSSIEAMGEPLAVHGREAVRGKGEWWMANHEIHGFEILGPYVNDDQFALHLRIDVTVKATGERSTMIEVALYTVQDGKVVEERFFY